MDAGPELSEGTRERLAAFLRRLPPTRARALAGALEQAREAGDTSLPYQFILEALGPALLAGEARVPGQAAERRAPEDLFREPFEDLIVARGTARGPGRIAQTSVAAAWSWLRDELLVRSQDAAVSAIMGGRPNGGVPSPQTVVRFQQACARALRDALEGEADPGNLAVKLGGREVLADIEEMAVFLEIAEEAREVRERFPRPASSLSSADLNTLVPLFDDFVHRYPERVAPFFFLVSGRLERPWDVLRAMSHLSGRVHSGRPSAADTDAVMDWLLRGLEAGAEFFRCLNTKVFEPGEVASELRSFTRLVNGISRAISVPPEGAWARRIMTCRSLVAEKMEIMMERVPRDILTALPVHKIGRFGRVRRRPDIGTPPDPGKSAQAVRMAQLVEACRPHAADAAFKVAYSEAVADAREGLSEYAGALIEELKRLDGEIPEAGRAYLDLVITLTGHVAGPEEAGRLRRETAAFQAGGVPGAAVS